MGKNVFVCDFGFSSLKWKYGAETGRIPSAYKRFDERVYVGEQALSDSDSADIQTMDDLVRMYPLFVKQAAAKCGKIEEGCTLAVGLPYEVWKTEMDKNRRGEISLVDSLRKSLVGGLFSELAILPQGLGGISHYASNLGVLDGNILGVDVGFNTVIITLFDSSSRQIIKDHTFFGKGVKDMAINYLMPKIHRHTGQGLNPIQICHLMEKGYIRQAHFQKVDISLEISSSAKSYCTELLSHIINFIKSRWASAADFDTILFFGGGSRLFKEPPTSATIKIVVDDEPEMSNCFGFELLANNFQKFGGV